ncbi:MAG: hypothetical protein KKB30_11390 [Proteobacteria bacterium]|nr:hypothetical protein [Pseudomonadota bacterium]MBU1714369.1 hypothetical protein [Pseudomonadota bacterium]
MSGRSVVLNFLYCLIAATFLVLPACGKKTMPVPPQTFLPATISDLSYQLDDNGVTLTWSWPKKTETGDNLAMVDGFEVSKAMIAEKDYCPDCPIPFTRSKNVEVEALPDASQPQTARYSEKNLLPDYRYFYRIKTRIGRYTTSAPSNTITFVRATPPATPYNLQLTSGDSFLELSWQPVTTDYDLKPLPGQINYQVYRSPDGKNFSPLGEPLSKNMFIDQKLINDARYFYRIRAFIDRNGTKSYSGLSTMVEGIPKDLSPPTRPGNVKAISTPEGIKILWDSVPAPDLKGYRIYRRQDSTAPESFKLIGEVGQRTGFIDQEAPGQIETWDYAITAFDQTKPANESSFSEPFKFRRIK